MVKNQILNNIEENNTNLNNQLNINSNNSLNLDQNYLINLEEQKNFLDSTIGKIINNTINVGLKMLLPDLIEDQVIQIKDTIIKEGFKEGLNKTIDSAIDLGKSIIGIATGKFENITQVEKAVQKGGILDITSGAIDTALKYGNKTGIIPKQISKIIKNGKNLIIDNLATNLEKALTDQVKSVENINKYSNNWNKYFKQQNFNKMDKEYSKIKKELQNIFPLENTIKQAREIENIHQLIKNNGRDFNLTKEQIELAKKLA